MSKAKDSSCRARLWQPITSAPVAADLELAVTEGDEIVAVQFPCRRVSGGWINSQTKKRLDVSPTLWRLWQHSEEPEALRELAERGRTLALALPEPDKSRILAYVETLEAEAAEAERQQMSEQRRLPTRD